MAYKVRLKAVEDFTVYAGEPSKKLLASDYDVRDALGDPYPGSRGDRLSHGAGIASRRKASGAWPSRDLTEASDRLDRKVRDLSLTNGEPAPTPPL